MTIAEVYASTSASPALVVFWPDTDGGPWDTEASELVEALSERLGVFVTCVGSGPRSLTFGDAVSAARFMGCRSAVVVAPVGCPTAVAEGQEPDRATRMPAVCVHAEWTLQGMAGAYLEARERLARAA